MAVRRSARLRSSSSSEALDSAPQPNVSTSLASVDEQDETGSNDDSTVRTPVAKKTSVKTPKTAPQFLTTARTPTSTSTVRPSREEMHPSKAHQSTTKQVDSGMILGFNPVKRDADGKILTGAAIETTPSKLKSSPALTQFGTPGYDIKFGQEAQLSDEAKQLMDRVREEAKQIKEKMLFEKSQQEGKDAAAERSNGGRKIAQPKGKAGRFSDIHMAEFRKMDSIANHASSFRATPGRFQPVGKCLKRTKSKAQLDEPEAQDQSPSRSTSSKRPTSAVTTPTGAAKRTKYNPVEDVPASPAPAEKKPGTAQKPAARSMTRATARPAGPRSASSVRSSLMTPTRASIARNTAGSMSLKAPKTSLIPSLARSPSTQGLASPRTPRTDFNPRIKGNLPGLGNLKSILRKRQPLFSRDPAKIAAGTHVAAPDFKPDSLFASKGDTEDTVATPLAKEARRIYSNCSASISTGSNLAFQFQASYNSFSLQPF
ncbi:hypothetical protein N7470_008688 [Penicillium chermesinum]|nr:hypothetical protein N7470_008688 [Penicillium chermesinum]